MEEALQHNDSPALPPSHSLAVAPRRTRRRWIIFAIIAVLLIYVASPYYAFWRFSVALQTHDPAALDSHVDFPSLRKSMKQQLNTRIAALRPQNPKRQKMFDTLSDAFGSRVIDSLVDAYLTPDGLAAFLANPKLPSEPAQAAPAAPPDGGVAPAAPPGAAPLIAPETNAPPSLGRRIDWSRVRYAFFTGPREFLVDVDGTKLRFHLNAAGWKLRSLELDLANLKI